MTVNRNKYLIDHIEEVIDKKVKDNSVTQQIVNKITPKISGFMGYFLVLYNVPSFAVPILPYINKFLPEDKFKLLDRDIKGYNPKEYIKKLTDYLGSFHLKKNIDNGLSKIIGAVFEKYLNSDDLIRDQLGDQWVWQKVNTIISFVNKDLDERVQDFMDPNQHRKKIILGYLSNISDISAHSEISEHFGIESELPKVVEPRSNRLIKDNFPKEIKKCKWWRSKNFYDALFGYEPMIRLHLLVWFINLSNKMKIYTYLFYRPESEVPPKYMARVKAFFEPSNLVTLVNMDETTKSNAAGAKPCFD